MIGRESDQPIVLGDGRADHGKGLTEVRSWQRKHCLARRAGFSNANLTAGNSNDDARREVSPSDCPIRKRVLSKSPVLKNGTPGSVRGRFGQLAVLPRWRALDRWYCGQFKSSERWSLFVHFTVGIPTRRFQMRAVFRTLQGMFRTWSTLTANRGTLRG